MCASASTKNHKSLFPKHKMKAISPFMMKSDTTDKDKTAVPEMIFVYMAATTKDFVLIKTYGDCRPM